MKALRTYGICMFSLLFHYAVDGQGVKVLTKAALHHTDSNSVSIERASLILYFNQEPSMKIQHDGKKGIFTCFFPHTNAQSSDILRMIDEVNNIQAAQYKIHLDVNKDPAIGVQISMQFDPTRLALSYDFFDAINLHKGIIFRLHDRSLVKQLQSTQKPTLLMASNERVPRIAIDCGHGGADVGAMSVCGLQEKDLCLQIGHQVAQLLRGQGVETFMTREIDEDCSYTTRTGVAHNNEVDAFVSIHANHAPNHHSHGIETFYAEHSLHKPSFSTLPSDELHTTSAWHHQSSQTTKKLAQQVHQSLIQALKKERANLHDRGVKKSASQLLLGSKVPTVLVEVGFLSNVQEKEFLTRKEYQQLIAQGIVEGIMTFCTQQIMR